VKVYVAGAPVDVHDALDGAPGTSLYSAYGSGCYESGAGGSSYREAVESPSSDWVELKPEVIPVTDQLGIAQWKSADGAVVFDGLRLLPGKDPCDALPPLLGNADARCIPTAQAIQGAVWGDDQCAGPQLASLECHPARLVNAGINPGDPGANDVFAGLYEIASTVDTGYVKNAITNFQCTKVPPSTTDPYYFYTQGARIVPSDYPPLSTKREGSGRLQTEYVTSAGKNLYVNAYYDTKLGKSCMPQALANGGTWCIPDAPAAFYGAGAFDMFADAQCSVPLVREESGAVPSWALAELPTCGTQFQLVAAVPHKGPVYQLGILPSDAGSPTCGQVTSRPGTAYFEAGAPLDPSTLFVPLPSTQ
jgi:hypothetical protein